MDKWPELYELLCSVLNITEPDGDRHVYLQPPPSVQMKYPAIVASLNNIDTKSANNETYILFPSYTLTLIDSNPNSIFVGKIASLPQCRFGRFYTADNLNHWTFTKY